MKVVGLLSVVSILCVPSIGHECQDSLDWAKKVADPLSDFTVLLYRAITQANAEKNVVFSPVSVSIGLALLKAGANGDTRAQMRFVLVKRGSNESDGANIYQALHHQLLTADHTHGVRTNVVNSLLVHNKANLKPEYVSLVRDCYATDVETCNFERDPKACREIINERVANGTANKIPRLFQDGSITAKTMAVLANAIYFKAPWYETFPSALMTTSEFYRFGREEEEQSVEYLSNEDQYLYSQTSTVSIVGIPYKGQDFYMYIILPKKRDGLEEFEKTFTGSELMFLINRTTVREVEVRIPKFKIRTRVDLKPILISLGLNDMFRDRANFNRMTDAKVRVNSAAHEAFIEVNENGTEGAGATGLAMRPMSARPISIPFVADHPFLYAIVHQPTHAIIFAGKVLYID
jgi:serpin B